MPALDQWEQRLKPYFNGSLRILGEIPLTRTDIEDIAEGVRACIRRSGMSEATQLLTRRYPHLFLAFLAGYAAHNTEQSYWIALGERLGVNHNHLFNYRWHYAFQNEVKQRGLPYFDSDDSANPFVTTIRFHGGIPAYSLPDFFERLLLPTVKRSSLSEVPTKQAMTAVLQTAYFVDSPVINFLENSGSLGQAFFDSCRKLARHYIETHGGLLDAASLNLPEYVVEAFADFMERSEEEGQNLRLRKPALGANPFGDLDRIWLKLPEQEIELRYAAGSLEWRVEWPGLKAPERVPCQLLRRRQYTYIRETFFPIEAAPNQINVALVYSEEKREELLQRWTLPLVPPAGRTPLLAFRTDGEQIRPGQGLPADFLRLIYPRDASLRIGGQGSQSEIYGPMYGAWQGWQIQEWNLTEAWSVEVVLNGQAMGSILSVAGRQPEPELSGGMHSPFGTVETPLYLGQPPELKIPLRPGLNVPTELGKWRIELASVWDTHPPVQFSGSVQNFSDQVRLEETSEETAAFLPLSCLVGNEPVGTYQLLVHGPGSARTDFRLRLWPRLTVLNLPNRLLPPEKNNEPLSFLLRIPAKTACEPQAGVGNIQVQEDMGGWKVTVEADVTEANLNLTWHGTGKQVVRVPIGIPIPRLRWALALDANQGNLHWTSSPVQKSAAALLQSKTAAIHIQAHGLGELLKRLRLELVEPEDIERPVQEAELTKTVFSPDWLRVPLGQFSGTLKNESQQGRFDLVLLPRREEPGMRLPLLFAPRSLDVSGVSLSQLDDTTWQLTWHEEHPLKNRRFLLIPAWQPWQEPWEYKIPNNARGVYLLENAGLPPARYLIYFYTAPEWEQARKTPPGDNKPHIVNLCSAEERLAEIEGYAQKTPDQRFSIMVEKICIYDSLGECEKRDLELSKCSVSFNHLTNLRLLLGLIEWLSTNDVDSPYKKFFLRSFFHPAKVKAVLETYKPPDPLLARYFSFVRQGAALYSESALLIAERTDDPAIIIVCLKHLLDKENELLILLMLEMIEKARLSNRDAVVLLSQKPRWAVEKLAEQESDPQSDRLLAALLPHLSQEPDLSFEFLSKLILRSLPYEPQSSVKVKYLETLVANEYDEGIQLVIQAAQDGTILKEEAERILSLAPDRAFQVLQQSEQTSKHTSWIAWVAEKFPGAAGVIRPRFYIQTPLGIGYVDRIEDLSGRAIQQTLLSSRDARLNLLIGDGADRFRIWLNLNDNTITFFEAQKAWQCPYCKYAHPDQRGIDRHYNQRHPGAQRSYRGIPATIAVDRAELKVVFQ